MRSWGCVLLYPDGNDEDDKASDDNDNEEGNNDSGAARYSVTTAMAKMVMARRTTMRAGVAMGVMEVRRVAKKRQQRCWMGK